MSKLFLTSSISIRPNRQYSRPRREIGKNVKAIKSENFTKRKKKSVFRDLNAP